MSSVCLSLVANLRCSGLHPQQAIGLLIPPIVEAFLLSFLIYTQRNKGRKYFLLIFDSYFYLALCTIEFISKFDNAIATSLSAFSLVDRIIGGMSGGPILFYILFLYLFARRHLIPILPHRFKWGVKILLTVLIPIILMFVEMGSFIGISYTVLDPPSKELAIRFTSSILKTLWTLFNSAGLALYILYQAITFCLATYRIFRHFHHSSNSTDGGRDNNPEQRGTLGGLGWMAAGIKLGAIEVLLGFIPQGFGMALPRRLVRLIGRAVMAWGVYKGMDENGTRAMFRVVSLDSIEGLPPRRIPVNPGEIRKLIGAPVADTFHKMSPTATSFHTRKKVPDAMKEINRFDMSFVDEKGGGAPQPRQFTYIKREVTPASVVPGLVAQSLTPAAATSALGPPSPTPRRNEKRVTLAYDGRAAPKLNIRLSAQTFADASTLLKKIDSRSAASLEPLSEDERSRRPGMSKNGLSPLNTYKRSRSTPPTTRRSDLDSFRRPTPATLPSSDLLPIGRPGIGNEVRPRPSQGSSQSRIPNPFADLTELTSPPPPESMESVDRGLIKREDSSGSTDESIAAIRRLSLKFPPLPPGVESDQPGDSPPRKLSSKRKPPPSLPQGRPRSLSQPQLPSQAFASPDLEAQAASSQPIDLSPRASLDQDVARRTRRRIRTHLDNVSPVHSLDAVTMAQWASRRPDDTPPSAGSGATKSRSTVSFTNAQGTPASGTNFSFSIRGHAVRPSRESRPYGFGRNADDAGRSPTTAYTRESSYSLDDNFSPLPDDRPVGRIARRALGIEQFLDKEKEKASQDGHDPFSPEQRGSVLSATDSQSRRRPRSGLDNTFKKGPKSSKRRPSLTEPTIDEAEENSPRLPRRAMTVDDPVAREAFAAAWRTVESSSSAPRFDTLKNMGSVRVQTTPTPTHNKVFSGQSMRVDEDATSIPEIWQGEIARGRPALTEDREYVRKARSMKAASVDSEIY